MRKDDRLPKKNMSKISDSHEFGPVPSPLLGPSIEVASKYTRGLGHQASHSPSLQCSEHAGPNPGMSLA